MAALPGFFKFPTPLLSLPAAFSVFVDRPLQILFRLVNSALASFVSVQSLDRRHGAYQEKGRKHAGQDSVLFCHKLPS